MESNASTRRHGLHGWCLLTAVIVGYDVWAIRRGDETLSTAFHRVRRHRVGKYVVSGVWGGLTYHLLAERVRVTIPKLSG